MLFCGFVSERICDPCDHTYVDSPEFLNRVKRDDLLQQLSPVVALPVLAQPARNAVQAATYLAARRLGEPQRPCVHEGVLDVEVLRVVEDGADIALGCGLTGGRLLVAVA
jgi:hypothetical protein